MTLSMTVARLAADQFDIVQHDHYKHKPMPLLNTHPAFSPNNQIQQQQQKQKTNTKEVIAHILGSMTHLGCD